MSADMPPQRWIDDRQRKPAEWRDPHGVIPEAFEQRWRDRGATTAREALQMAEREPTATDTDALPRCPECDSIKIQLKTGVGERDREIDTAYKCNHCGHHFDDPGPSVNERYGEQTALGEVSEDA
jgi:DNA-directed RNA polymerase subunit RPC12/RpoP